MIGIHARKVDLLVLLVWSIRIRTIQPPVGYYEDDDDIYLVRSEATTRAETLQHVHVICIFAVGHQAFVVALIVDYIDNNAVVIVTFVVSETAYDI